MHNKSNNLNGPEIKGIIFDLDGVLVDTAEYHYQAWRKVAIEEDIPFNRKINEKLRGVSRRRSLEIMLQGRRLSEEKMVEMMERKNNYYKEFIEKMTPRELLPGVHELLAEIRNKGIKFACNLRAICVQLISNKQNKLHFNIYFIALPTPILLINPLVSNRLKS